MMSCFLCEKGLDTDVESDSARSGDCGDVGGAAQLNVQYHAEVPRGQ